MTYIYGLVDPRTNKVCYIGKSNNPDKRLKGHIKETKNGSSFRIHNLIRLLIQQSLMVSFIILEECNEYNWQECEKYWIKYYRDLGYDLTNLTEGGDGVVGQEYTEEYRRKLSVSHLGQITWMKGKHHRQDSIEKLKDAAEKQWEDPAARELKSKQAKEQFSTEESRLNLSKKLKEWHKTHKHPMQGRKQTQEAKDKVSKANTGYIPSEEVIENLREIMKGNKYRVGKIPWNKGKKYKRK